MTIPLWCLAVVMFLPYLLAGYADYLRIRQFGSMDNDDPRTQSAKLEGVGARAWAAQQNAWEALPFFAAAVVIVHLSGVRGGADWPAMIFAASRVAHAGCYLAGLSTLRSLAFMVGLVAVLWMVVLAIAV